MTTNQHTHTHRATQCDNTIGIVKVLKIIALVCGVFILIFDLSPSSFERWNHNAGIQKFASRVFGVDR